jgi:4-amino-4-deoxy-L-arabinose transferase-like glycosyltransferase
MPPTVRDLPFARLPEDPCFAWAAAGALTVLFAAMCAQGLGAVALWNDEAFSFFVAQDGLAHTLRWMRQDTQPPAYYLALSLWLYLGHGVAVLRGLSALALALAVPLLFDAARRLLGPRAALLAVLLFVLGPESVAWAQKARPYAFQAFCVAVGFWGFVRIWTAAPPRPRLGWLAYVLGAGAAVMAQYPAVFFIVGCNVAMAVRVAGAWRAEKRLAGAWVLAQLALWLVWLPWLPDAVPQVTGHLMPAEIAARHGNFLIDGRWLADTLAGLLAIPYLWRALPLFEALYAVLALLGAWALLRAGRPGLPVLGAVAVPLLVCVLAWALIHPVFGYVTYTFIWLRLPYALLIAAGLLAIRPRLLGAGVFGLLLLGNLWGLANYKATPTVPLDRVAALIGAEAQPGDGVLLSTTQATRWALAYYLGPPYAGRLDGLDVSDVPATGWPILTPDAARRERRLWVVQPGGEELPFAPATLAPAMPRALHQEFGNVLVERYDRAP